jgi:hypothetical protein
MSVFIDFNYVAFTRCIQPVSAPSGGRITETFRGTTASLITLSYPYRPGSVEVWVNGLVQRGFTQSGESTITLSFTPAASDTITISYVIQTTNDPVSGPR